MSSSTLLNRSSTHRLITPAAETADAEAWLKRIMRAGTTAFSISALSVGTCILAGALLHANQAPWASMLGDALRGFAIACAATAVVFPLAGIGATYLAVYARAELRKPLVLMIDLGASVPGVVWAWVVLTQLKRFAPALATASHALGIGVSIVSLTLLANCTRRVYSALRDIPVELFEAAIALGASRWDAMRVVGFRSARDWLLRAALRCLTRATAESVTLFLVARTLSAPVTTLGARIADTQTGSGSFTQLANAMPAALLLTIACYLLRRLERDPSHAARTAA